MNPRRPSSPSFGMSMPTSTCFRTTSLIPSRMSAASFAWSYGRPTRRAFMPSMISRVRIRLPVWVVRIRSVLRFTYYLCALGLVATGWRTQALVDDEAPRDRRDVFDPTPSGFDEQLVLHNLEDAADALLAA